MAQCAVRQDYLERPDHCRGRYAGENQNRGLGDIAVRQTRHGRETAPIRETHRRERFPVLRRVQSLQGMQSQGRSPMSAA